MLTTDNWIALFFLLSVPFIAIILNIWHRYSELKMRYQRLNDAYRSLDKEMTLRAQNLRSLNNSLIDEVKKHEEAKEKLQLSESYLYSIIDSLPSILIGVTSDGTITHWNKSAERGGGLKEKEVLGKNLWDIAPEIPIDKEMVRQAIKEQKIKTKQNFKIVHKTETLYLDIAIYPLLGSSEQTDHLAEEAIIQIDDVTVNVMMESTMIQNEKMLSLGELAAGMAHEINNPLGAILQSVQNIERRISPEMKRNQDSALKAGTNMDSIATYLEERQITKFLNSIRDAGERSAHIVSNMLEFSHRSHQPISVDINELAEHCLELADNNFKIKLDGKSTRIKVKKSLGKELPNILCSPAEIQQVLLNLLRNASQCFVTTTNNISPIAPPPTVSLSTALKSGRLEIKVSDNGPGIPEDICRHIFEPFYTTKEVGEGTGLGLSISYFIITEHHNGNIQVDSTIGSGTTFTITLPINSSETEAS